MNIIVLGNPGSDAGYWIIGSDGQIRHVGGWAPERLAEVTAALNIIRQATQLKTPGLAEAAVKSVVGFAQKELQAHIKEGGAVFLAA
jgi:hypothetical protein